MKLIEPHSVNIFMLRIITCFFCVLFIASCSEDNGTSQLSGACIKCHQVEIDINHQIACTSCHKGNDQSEKKDVAHFGFVRQPAHADHMSKSCGTCHADQTSSIVHSLHFTLKNSTNLFLKAFGASAKIDTFRDTPKTIYPETPLGLANDLLRRRCFRCHPYTDGDNYPAIKHGTGCAACHLPFAEGKLASHTFQAPQDQQCLSCHYGNFVGFDYYGRFEHDYTNEYRTPYTTSEKHFRPYGIEYRELQPDVHQQKGMICVDCHTGQELMDTKTSSYQLSCKGCHQTESLSQSLPPRTTLVDGSFILQAQSGEKHIIPIMQNSAHFNTTEKATCQTCHAQWTFGDEGKHFLRSDSDDFDSWSLLTNQGNSELEEILLNNTDYDKEELPVEMTDKITGKSQPGLWLKGFTQRRWENVKLGRDKDGVITTVRPMLDYKLSWIDADDEIRFDSISPSSGQTLDLPYTPHTIGPAGLFYEQRIRAFLDQEKNTKVQ